MLAIERQVPGELIHQQPGDEAHIGPAAVQDPRRRRHGEDLCGLLSLHHGPTVLQDLVAARALGEPVGDLLADDLELIRREALELRVHQHDRLDGNLRLVEELQLLAALSAVRARDAPGMGGDALRFSRLRWRRKASPSASARGPARGRSARSSGQRSDGGTTRAGAPGGDLLGLGAHQAASSAALIALTSVRFDEPVDAALCMTLIISR